MSNAVDQPGLWVVQGNSNRCDGMGQRVDIARFYSEADARDFAENPLVRKKYGVQGSGDIHVVRRPHQVYLSVGDALKDLV